MVLYDESGAGLFAFCGPLRGFASLELGVVPSPGCGDAGLAEVGGGIDEDDGVALLVEAGLEEEWGVEDDAQGCGSGGFGGGFGGGPSAGVASVVNRLVSCLGDERVDELFESCSLLWVVEDDACDGGAVDLAIGPQGAGPPPGDEGVADLRGAQRVCGLCVGVDDDPAESAEGTCDGGLAAADAADDSQDDGVGVGPVGWGPVGVGVV